MQPSMWKKESSARSRHSEAVPRLGAEASNRRPGNGRGLEGRSFRRKWSPGDVFVMWCT